MMYVRFRLSLRDVEDLLHERGIDTGHYSNRAPYSARLYLDQRGTQKRHSVNWKA